MNIFENACIIWVCKTLSKCNIFSDDCGMLSEGWAASNWAAKTFTKIETDYVIIQLKFLLQNHDPLTVFRSKTAKKNPHLSKIPPPAEAYSSPSAVKQVTKLKSKISIR